MRPADRQGGHTMHIRNLVIVACPFLVACYAGGAHANNQVRAPGANTSFALVSAIEGLALLQAQVYEHLVVDSASLVSVARMTAAQIRELGERLRGRVSVGEATLAGACQRRPNARCWSMHVLSFEPAGDSARVSVNWAPVAGCGHSTRTFLLDSRGVVVSEDAQITGDCVP